MQARQLCAFFLKVNEEALFQVRKYLKRFMFHIPWKCELNWMELNLKSV